MAACARHPTFVAAQYGLAVLVLATASPVLADGESGDAGTERKPWSLEIDAGLEYDSNVSVAELDSNTGSGDFAGVVDFSAGYDFGGAGNTLVSLGYDFFQTLHFDFSDFNIQSHLLSVSAEHNFGRISLGAMYHFDYALLGGDGFLEFHRVTPFTAFFLASNVYVRAFYEYTDKSIIPSPLRDAQVQGGGADAYVFTNGANSYFSAGYKYENADAAGPEFDFTGHNLKVRFVTRIPIGKTPSKLKLSGHYEIRDYANITPSIGAIRDDDIVKLTAEWEIPFGERYFSTIEYQYADYSSNLPSADFARSVASLKFGARF